jgi:NADH-quinone oxidoreductase subunit F
MDLRFSAGTAATDDERAAVDAVLGPPESGWQGGARTPLGGRVALGGHAARSRRHLLLPVLHALQDRVGHISAGALDYACTRLTVPPAEAYGVASFYALLRTEPGPPTVVHVCDDVACRVSGAEALCAAMERRFGPEGAPAGGDGAAAAWTRSPCLGQCERAPAALIQRAGERPRRAVVAPATAAAVAAAALDGAAPAGTGGESPVPQALTDRSALRLLRRAVQVDPASLDSYRAAGGYQALRTAIRLGPAGVIREVKDAGLLGRGGAAFPTGRKWEAVAANPARPHYVVCNADESETGTFKDRVIMERDPFAVIESLTIMGYACGAEQGYIYVRGEYPLAQERLQHALARARERGFLGTDIMGAGFRFDIEIRRGAGAYIAGEETALFNSVEGRRAEPRNKPPFPVQSGLFGAPTAVNNVETLLNVPEILRIGAPAYARIGTAQSTGTRLLCLSGRVQRPGLYEVVSGTTLREALALAGGVRDGRPLRAVLLGGAAGSFVGEEALDTPLTFEDLRAIGATLGSGVVMAFDDTVDMTDVCRRIARFFRDESCGQCVPCRVGTVRQEELLARLAAGRPLGGMEHELALLDEIGTVMRDASICGLGQTAAAAIGSAVRLGLIGAGGGTGSSGGARS